MDGAADGVGSGGGTRGLRAASGQDPDAIACWGEALEEKKGVKQRRGREREAREARSSGCLPLLQPTKILCNPLSHPISHKSSATPVATHATPLPSPAGPRTLTLQLSKLPSPPSPRPLRLSLFAPSPSPYQT